jgi:pimeloyl-ACP methyl ester carboxylesterase
VLFGAEPDPTAVAAVREQFKTTDPAILRASYRAFTQADVRPGLDALVRLPVSIMVGRQDVVTPPARSRAMTMTLTRARYVAIREAGHLLPYEAPHRIIDELRAVVSAVGDRLRTVAARQDAGQPSSSESTSAHPFDRAGFS